jgi:hypothetical protein
VFSVLEEQCLIISYCSKLVCMQIMYDWHAGYMRGREAFTNAEHIESYTMKTPASLFSVCIMLLA